MPTYEYRCKECGAHLEVVQSFTDDALTTCEACGGPLRKLFGNVGISFKGSGFYKTDSRNGAGKKSTADASSGSPSDNGSSSSSSDTKSDTKPDAKADKKADKAPAASASPSS